MPKRYFYEYVNFDVSISLECMREVVTAQLCGPPLDFKDSLEVINQRDHPIVVLRGSCQAIILVRRHLIEGWATQSVIAARKHERFAYTTLQNSKWSKEA